MKLIDDFFKVLESSVSDTGFTTTIELNPKHIVYSGHFPGHPVTPGVIQLKIVHELLEKHIDRKLKLKTISQCKFLKILNPNKTSQIVINIEFDTKDQLLIVKARGESAADIYFKLNSIYEI